jgi:hypothetical protein
MSNTMTQWLAGIAAERDRRNVRGAIEPMVDRMSSQAVSTAGLVISSGGATTAKTGASDAYFVANGKLVKIAAGTAMPALAGSITAASFNVFCFFVDAGGTVTSQIGIEATTLANVTFPDFPKNKALVGFLIVTYASTFVGGTTALDTATTIKARSARSIRPSWSADPSSKTQRKTTPWIFKPQFLSQCA